MYTIGDFLIRIKNGYAARKINVEYPYSKSIDRISSILKDEGYIKNVEVKDVDGHKKIVSTLLYRNRRPALHDVKLISRPSVHRYANKNKVKRISNHFGISLISTSKGIMTGTKAIKEGVGGELICEIA